MLLKCPECDLPVSDKAITCPHCGYPLKSQRKKRRPNSPHHMRLPNGFGQISKINGQNLRNPYRVMVPVGKTAEGRPISKILRPKGYFATYNEAYAALVEYNRNPYDLATDITMSQLFEKWSAKHFKTLAYNSIKNANSAWKCCSSIYNMKVKEVRARHLKSCMEHGTDSLNMRASIKSVLNQMLDYAVEYEIVDRNYARTFSKPKNIKHKNHMSFSEEELKLLWENIDVPYMDVLLIQCYSGWRPQELGLLEIENINLEERTMIGGMKTEAGLQRLVPIHSIIYPLVELRYKTAKTLGSKYLFNCTDTKTHRSSLKLTYDKYRHRFDKIIDLLGLDKNHKPHDGRKTFVTMAKEAKVDEYAIKYMVGHSINDITEAIYTDRSTDWLKEEIEKINSNCMISEGPSADSPSPVK